jgi:hypothetical protein
MKPVGRLTSFLGTGLLVATLIGISSQAEPVKNSATIRSVRSTSGGGGHADYSTDAGSNWKKASVGTRLQQGSVIRTAPGTVCDLFLGDNGPVVRVTENTQLGIDALTVDRTGQENVIETQLDLRNGRILGNVKHLAAASKYEVKTPLGVAGIRGTQYDISANGRVHVFDGTVIVVYVVPGIPPQTVTVGKNQTAFPPTPTSPAQVINESLPWDPTIDRPGGGEPVPIIVFNTPEHIYPRLPVQREISASPTSP